MEGCLALMRADISGILTITINLQVRKLIEMLNVKGYSVKPHPLIWNG